MGALYGAHCFPYSSDAETAAYSAVVPAVGVDGHLRVVSFSSGSFYVKEYDDSGLVSTIAVPSIGFAPCTVGGAAVDGIAVGWLVVIAFAAGFAARVIRKALFT